MTPSHLDRVWTLVRQAYRTAKTQRQLWLFGLFAAGAGASFNWSGDTAPAPEWLPLLLVGVGVVALLSLALHLVSEGALIHGVAHSRDGGRTSIGVGFRTGLRFAPRVAGVKALVVLSTLLCAAVIAAPLAVAAVASGSLVAGGVISAVVAVAFVPVFLSIHLIGTYSLRAVVLENHRVLHSIRTAKSFLASRIVTSLWLLVAQSVGSSLASFVGFVLALPILGLGFVLYLTLGLVPALLIGGVLMLPLALAVNGAVGTYRSSLWTHLYLAERTERV